MLAATIFNQVVTTLKDNDNLSDYVKNVFKSYRYNVEPDSMPCLFVDVSGNNEIDNEIHTHKKIWLTLKIIAYTYNITQPDKAVVGGEDYKGVLDIENDIRACLQSSYNLGGDVIDIQFEPTVFDALELGKFPVRGLLMPIKITYRQTEGT